MARRDIAVFTALALLGACATAQENPNYQFSSKYGGDVVTATAPVQLATYQGVPDPTETVAPAPAPILSAPVSAVSETESAYAADTMDGTPGYEIMMADMAERPEVSEPVAAPAPGQPVEVVPARPSGARPVTYDMSQNVIIAGTDTVIAPTETRPRDMAYTVQPGDTVYSLSRRLCVGVPDVTRSAGIGADYAIQIGQTLSLPQSRC